jgi:hypothetical protein
MKFTIQRKHQALPNNTVPSAVQNLIDKLSNYPSGTLITSVEMMRKECGAVSSFWRIKLSHPALEPYRTFGTYQDEVTGATCRTYMYGNRKTIAAYRRYLARQKEG